MRVMPGGSQYLCTGSLMPSKVCLAPNGGLASFHFAAAQGAMGASSGFWPKGSEESHVFIRIPSGLGAQRPDKSGACADVWGCLDFAASARAAVCADSTDEKTNTATSAFVKRTKRFRILQLLDSDSILPKLQYMEPMSPGTPALVLSIAEGSRRLLALTNSPNTAGKIPALLKTRAAIAR